MHGFRDIHAMLWSSLCVRVRLWVCCKPQGYNFVLAFLGVTSPLAKLAVAVASLPALALVSAWYAVSGRFLPSRNMTTAYWEGLISGAQSLRCPHLLLFSADDPVVPAKHVRDFAKRLGLPEAKGGGGVAVKTKEWEVSEHVGHWKCHPDEYKNCVRTFLEK
jgi:pimeloyl-ACP methyl ester carboxylesterase